MDCSLPGTSIHGIFKQEYQNGLPFSPPRGLPNSEIEPASLVHTHTHTHTQSVIKETKLSQCCNSHYHLQNENDSWCKGNNDQSQLPKNTPRKPSKNWVLRTVLSKVYVCVLSSRNWVHGHLFVTPWTADSQASLSVESSRKEHWSRLPFPPAGDLPDPGTEPESPVSPALVGGLHWRAAWEPNSVLHQPLMSLQPKTQLRTRMLLTHSTHQAVFFLFQSQKQKRTSLSKSFFKMKTCIVFFFPSLTLHCLIKMTWVFCVSLTLSVGFPTCRVLQLWPFMNRAHKMLP